jgi:hypothetical protein
MKKGVFSRVSNTNQHPLFFSHQPQQYVLGADIVMIEPASFFLAKAKTLRARSVNLSNLLAAISHLRQNVSSQSLSLVPARGPVYSTGLVTSF